MSSSLIGSTALRSTADSSDPRSDEPALLNTERPTARRRRPTSARQDDSCETLLREYRRTGDRRLRNRVVERHEPLATAIARRFGRSSEPLDDLVQVAFLGVVKAAERFDPDAGHPFVAFASVTVRGELRRHFRDHGWALRVPRRLQELRYEIRTATDVLAQRLGRSPTTQEVAAKLGISTDEVIDAMCADDNYRSRSLEERSGTGPSIGELAGGVDARFDRVDAEDAFRHLADSCDPRLRRILQLRYEENLTQSDIGRQLGISQVHVSRLLAEAHRLLRRQLRAAEEV